MVDRRGNHDKNRGIRHLTNGELMDRNVKGLCFCCGDKFHPLQQCYERQMRLIVLGDQETVNKQGEVVALELEDDGIG